MTSVREEFTNGNVQPKFDVKHKLSWKFSIVCSQGFSCGDPSIMKKYQIVSLQSQRKLFGILLYGNTCLIFQN